MAKFAQPARQVVRPHDATMPIRAGGKLATQATSLARDRRRLAATSPCAAMVTHRVARSIPMVSICIGSSLHRWFVHKGA
jgi:hypothetical protein